MKKLMLWALLGLLIGAVSTGAKQEDPAVTCTIALDRDVLPAGGTQKAVVKITLDAPTPPKTTERPPVNLAIVLDRSGSMSGSKIERAREAAIEAIRRLSDRDMFSVVIYDHEVETLVPAQSARYTEAVESRIRAIQSRGNTALFGGVSQGAAEVRKHLEGDYIHRIVLLSDGLANVGPSAPADLARLGKALVKEGISVSTVGVGTDFNEDLMTQLSQASDGNHYFVESSHDLPRIFAQELGDVLSVVARKVVLELDCPEGIRPIRIIGREGMIRGRKAEIHLNQLYGGQAKYALIEVEVPAARPNQELPLGTARCSYENALNSRSEETTALAKARFSAEMEEVRRFANRDVQEALTYNEIAVTRDRALDLYNEGRNQEAAAMLRRKSDELREANVKLGFEDMAEEAEGLSAQAPDFENAQIDNVGKKEIRAESYSVRSQQRDY